MKYDKDSDSDIHSFLQTHGRKKLILHGDRISMGVFFKVYRARMVW